MKNFFEKTAQDELLARLEKLNANTQPLWGRMTAAQMLAHCNAALKTPTGELTLKPMPFLIRLMGRLIKKKALGSKPYSKNSPTAPEYLQREAKDFETEKAGFKQSFAKLAAGSHVVKVNDHTFFGKMTPDEWGRHMYKHTDYHFGQFGV